MVVNDRVREAVNDFAAIVAFKLAPKFRPLDDFSFCLLKSLIEVCSKAFIALVVKGDSFEKVFSGLRKINQAHQEERIF